MAYLQLLPPAMFNELLTVALGYLKLWQLNNSIQFLNIRNHSVHGLGKGQSEFVYQCQHGAKEREGGGHTNA